jgi:hypothetical protein
MKTKKTLLLTIAFLSISILATGQNVSNKDRFDLSVSDTKVSMTSDSKVQFDVSILKSKRCRNAKVKLATQNLPVGVTVKFEKNEDNKDLYHVTFKADASIQEGNYTVILYGLHYSKKRGVAVPLNITNTITEGDSIAATER